MIGVEKVENPNVAFYRSNIVTNSDVKTAECAKAAHQLASLNAKFLAKFNYATDYAGNIMDMELDDDLLEFLLLFYLYKSELVLVIPLKYDLIKANKVLKPL